MFPGLQKIGNAVCLVVRQIGSILPRPCCGCGPICGGQTSHQGMGGIKTPAYRTQLPYPEGRHGFQPVSGSGNFHPVPAPNFTSVTGNVFPLRPIEELETPAAGATKIGNRLYQRTLYIQNRNAAIRFLNKINAAPTPPSIRKRTEAVFDRDVPSAPAGSRVVSPSLDSSSETGTGSGSGGCASLVASRSEMSLCLLSNIIKRLLRPADSPCRLIGPPVLRGLWCAS